METREADFYDLPMLYDVLHAPGTAADLDGFQRMAERYVDGSSKRWLEPACGTGRFVRLAAKRGLRATGIDLSEAMIGYAQRRGIGRYVLGDITKLTEHFKPGSFDFAFCPINSVRHLPSDAAMVRHLKNMHAVLKPGGVYAVGINYGGVVDGVPLEFPSEDIWAAARGTLRVTQVVQYETPQELGDRTEHVRSVLTVQRGARPSEQVLSTYTLRTYTRAHWDAVVRASELRPVATVDEAGREVTIGDAGYGIHILKK